MSEQPHSSRRIRRLLPHVVAAMATVLSIVVVPSLSPTEAGAVNFPGIDWSQCRNDSGGGEPTTGGTANDESTDPCNWVDGNLGASNSIYTEGDVVPQRAVRAVAAAGPHVLDLDHSFYNASQEAYTYDFYASPDTTLGSDLAACNDVRSTGIWAGVGSTACDLALANRLEVPLPTEGAVYPFVTAAEADALADGVTRDLWISCGALDAGAVLRFTPATQCTDVVPTVLGHGNSSGALLADQDGPPTSDDFVQLRVNFTTPQASSVVFIWIGGHLAKASFWNDAALVTDPAYRALGASSAAGSSFHQRLISWDEGQNIGNRDNQVQAGAVVPPGSITIVKDDTADTGTSFPFTAPAPLADFVLGDDGVNAAGENVQTFPALPTGAYRVDEVLPAGWTLEGIVCGATDGSTFQTSGAGVTIDLHPGDDVLCTFTNSPNLGALEVTKVAEWNGVPIDASQSFEICIAGPTYPTGTEPGACQTAGPVGGTLTWDPLFPGDYTVTETDPGSDWVVSGGQGAVTAVGLGGTATAPSITNSRRLGSLQVAKVVDWNGVPVDGAQTFEICLAGPSYPTGTEPGACQSTGAGGGTLTWADLVPGGYTVAETDPGTEWAVTGDQGVTATVPTDGGAAPASSITNTRRLGSLEVTKVVDWNGVTPDPAQSFTLCITGPSHPTPTLGNGGCQTVDGAGGTRRWDDLVPGDYTVSEPGVGAEWEATVTPSATVAVPTDGSQAAATVTNARRLGSLEVTKVVNWNGVTVDGAQTFEICLTGPSFPTGSEPGACQDADADGGTLTWDDLVPGEYTVAETDPGVEWIVGGDDGVTAAVPTDGGSVDAGTITNTRLLGSLQVTKTVDWAGIPEDTSQTFEICITGPSYPAPTVDNGGCQEVDSDGATLTWDDLIPGLYTDSETDPGADWVVSGGQGDVVAVPVDGGQGTGATITNTRRTGALQVAKIVDWNGVPTETTTFEVCITGPSYPAPTVGNGGCQTLDENGGTVGWDPLVPGEYTVTETDPGAEWTVSGDDGATVTVPLDAADPVPAITNTRRLGSLSVDKEVDWNGLDEEITQTFEICITGPSYPTPTPDNGGCQEVDSDGGTLDWVDLVPGEYTVTETDPGTEWTVTGDQGVAVAVPSDGSSVDAGTITNTRRLGSLEVTKVVDWNGVPADPNASFEICIAGPSYPIPGADPDACRFVGAGETAGWTDLLPGLYEIGETPPGQEWAVTGDDGATVTVPTDGGSAPPSTVTNTRRLGSLEVTKVVDWNGVEPDASQVFEICITGPSYPTGTESGACGEVGADGGTLSWDSLLPGDYEAAESDPGPAWTVTGDQGATATVASGVAADAGTITNTAKLGGLQLDKVVDWNGTAPDADAEFTICLTGPSFPTGTEPGACQVVDFDGGTLTWVDLVPGDYVVNETDPGDMWVVGGGQGATTAVPPDGTTATAAAVTNTHEPVEEVVEERPTTTVPPTTVPPPTAPPPSVGLAFTGADLAPMVGLALVMILVGLGLRRRGRLRA